MNTWVCDVWGFCSFVIVLYFMSVLTNGFVYQNMNVVLYSVLFLFALFVSLVLLSNVCFICFTVVVVSIRGRFFFAGTILSLKMCFVCFSAVVLCRRDVGFFLLHGCYCVYPGCALFFSFVLSCLSECILFVSFLLSIGIRFVCITGCVLSILSRMCWIVSLNIENLLCFTVVVMSIQNVLCLFHWCCSVNPGCVLFHCGCLVYLLCVSFVSRMLFFSILDVLRWCCFGYNNLLCFYLVLLCLFGCLCLFLWCCSVNPEAVCLFPWCCFIFHSVPCCFRWYCFVY